MTYELAQKLKRKFPAINNFQKIIIYECNERIYLNFKNEIFENAPLFKSHEKINEIAKQIFDVKFAYESKGDLEKTIFFEPDIKNLYHLSYEDSKVQYQLNHFGHYIQVHLPSKHPLITISTGNRGNSNLFEKQRKKYYLFINKVYDKFIEEIIN